MSSSVGSSPRQFRVPLGLQVRYKRSRRPRARDRERGGHNENEELIEPFLPRSLNHKAIAPYNPKTELEDSYLRFLIHHYVTIVTEKTVVNVGPRFEWYPLAVRDQAFFHAVISSTSSHAAYMQQVELPRDFYYHRGEAIRLVNKRIVEGAHDEGTINAIAVFSQQESFEGRAETAKTHIDGLLQIVQAAGGPLSPTMSEHTRRHVFLTDLAACISLQTRPILVASLDMSDLSLYFGNPTAAIALHTNNFGTRLFNFTGSLLSNQAATVLWGIRSVSERLEAIKQGLERVETPRATDIQFTDRVEVLERLTHPLWYVEYPEYQEHAIFRTFGFTTLIYIYMMLRELPKEIGMNAMLASRVKTLLEGCGDLNVLLATFQDLLLWQMFICGQVADARDKPFFARQATKILMIRKIESQKDILSAAGGFIWPERQTNTPGSATLSGSSRTASDRGDVSDDGHVR